MLRSLRTSPIQKCHSQILIDYTHKVKELSQKTDYIHLLSPNGSPANPVRALEHLIYSVRETLEKRL